MRRTLSPALLTLALTACAATESGSGESWPQFRGPGGRAVASDTPIPLDFGPESRVLWKTEIPAGSSSPCIHGEHLFITGAAGSELSVLALDRASGDVLWTRTFQGDAEPDYGHTASRPAMGTPCTDGERVYAYFGAYGLVALDFDGETVWEQRMPVPEYSFGSGTSPILCAGRVVIDRDGAPEAALLAFDAEDGAPAWTIPRIGFIETHATPFVWKNAQREELVVPGTRELRSYDPVSGVELWRVVDVTLFTCTTPTGDDDTLYFAGWSTPNATGRALLEVSFGPTIEISDAEADDVGLLFDRLDAESDGDGALTFDELPPSRIRDAIAYIDRNASGAIERAELVGVTGSAGAPGKNIALAVAAGGEGDITESHVRWTWTRGLPYVASPLLYRGRLWLFKAGGILTCLDAATGEPVVNRQRLDAGGEYYMSPVGAAGHVLIASAEGVLFVFDAEATELEPLHQADFGEALHATPAVVDGRVYLRTPTTVWAFGG